MTINLFLPGWEGLQVIVPDNATLEEFSQKVFELTGVQYFGGFGYSGQNEILGPSGAAVMVRTPYDRGAVATPQPAGSAVSLNVAPSTALSSLFSNGDVVMFNEHDAPVTQETLGSDE